MEIAEKEFKIPLVLEPEHFASPHLDELSGMTYLSYFMKEEDSPGYYSSLNWVKNQIPNFRINNFRVRIYNIEHHKLTFVVDTMLAGSVTMDVSMAYIDMCQCGLWCTFCSYLCCHVN